MTCKAENCGTQCERKGGHKGSHEGYLWVTWDDPEKPEEKDPDCGDPRCEVCK